MRTIRSFVRREGRMTCAQQLAFETLWPQYGIDVPNLPSLPRCAPNDETLDFKKIFGRDAPTALEIGFGNGEALIAMALQRPEVNFIGVEVYQTGTGGLFQALQAQHITNVRVIHADIVPLLSTVFPKHCFNHVYIYFPDPWPKRKHVKRRLLQTAFLDQIREVLIPGGVLHFATDWQDYARHARQVLMQHPDFTEITDKDNLPAFCPRPPTKFYRKALQLGHVITDLSFKACK